jgi:hypothetical protein
MMTRDPILAEAMARLTPLQREIVRALLAAEDEGADEILARRHGVEVADVRRERGVVRARLQQILAELRSARQSA